MKKIIFLLFFVFFLGTNVSASSCKPKAFKEVSYLQGEYRDIGYCDVSKSNMAGSGCMAVSYAMLVANLTDSSVTPKTIRDEICNSSSLRLNVRGVNGNGPGQASYMMGSGVDALAVRDKYHLKIERYTIRDINDIKESLKSGSMFIASIKCPSPGSGNAPGCKFTSSSSGHYVVLSNVDETGKIVVLNPGSSNTRQNSWDDSEISANILNVINAGFWKVDGTSDDCSKVLNGGSSGSSGSSTENSGSTKDDYENFFPDLETDSSHGIIFVDSNGDLNELGQFVDGAFLFIKIAAPVLVLILSTLDYIKAISNSNQDDIKKANQRTIKRAIIGLIIFFLPFLLELLFHLFGLYDISIYGVGS